MEELAYQLIVDIERRLEVAVDDADVRAVRWELHGACRMAVRLGALTHEQWDAIEARAHGI